MRVDREFWLRFRGLRWKLKRLGVTVLLLVTAFVAIYNWYEYPNSAALDRYDDVSRMVETEQHALDRMRTWEIAWPSSDPRSQDAEKRAEQQQRDLVLRLAKERDALAKQLGHHVKPPDAPPL